MTTDTPTPEQLGETNGRSGAMKAGVAGAVVGVTALLGSFLVLGSGAGAQDAGSTTAPPATGEEAESSAAGSVDDAALDAYFSCVEQAWDDAFDGKDDEALSDTEFEALAESAEAAEAACESELPAGVDIDEVWADLEDEWGDEFDVEELPEVAVQTADGITIVDLGEGDGTVTITKTGEDISVATDGDLTSETITWDDLEAEFDEMDDDMDDELDELDDIDDEMDDTEETELDD